MASHWELQQENPGVDEGSWMVLSVRSFGITWVGNLESAGTGEVDTLGNIEVTMVGNELGICDGEVLGITIGVADRIKLVGDELSGQVLPVGKV